MTREWLEGENNLVVLAAADELTLRGILYDLPTAIGFTEPDVGNQLTAVALPGDDETKAYLRGYRLALAG